MIKTRKDGFAGKGCKNDEDELEIRAVLTCCRARCPASKYGRKAREAFARHRTPLGPIAAYNLSKPATTTTIRQDC